MTESFPQQFRELAEKRDSRALPKARRQATWVLDIAGPFSFYPARKGSMNRQAEQVADIVSSLLCLAVRHRIADGAIYITIADRTTTGTATV